MDERRLAGTGDRLDKLMSSDSLSRSRAARLIQQGLVKVSGKVVTKPSFVPDVGAPVVFDMPIEQDMEPVAEDIPLRLVYEDADLAVVDKPCGMVVHPAQGNQRGTLVNALLYQLDSLSSIGGEARRGIVHRLDKDTSGLIIVAKNDQAHRSLSRQLADRSMDKHYLALVAGRMKEQSGSIDLPIGRSPKDRKKMAVVPEGRQALTRWQLLTQGQDSALLKLQLVTGRTHQIRVHMAHLHHPVLGDPLYANRQTPKAPRLMLHAWQLGFTHPVTGQPLHFTAAPDPAFGLAQQTSDQ